MQILKLVYIWVSLFLLLFLESFFHNLIGFHLVFLLFLFLYRKIDWKWLLGAGATMFLVLDVVMHYSFGSNLLIALIPLSIYVLASMFVSAESGVVSYLVKFFVVFLYYILLAVVPIFFLEGHFGFLDKGVILKALVMSVLSTLLLYIGDRLQYVFRKKGSDSLIRFK